MSGILKMSLILSFLKVFDQHCASVAELGGPQAALLSSEPLRMRSSVILSAAPSRESCASWAEYARWAQLKEETVARHVQQRDAKQTTGGGELYKLVRKIEVDLDKLYYEVCMHLLLLLMHVVWQVNGTAFIESIADNRNLGNQKYNKVRMHACTFVCDFLLS